MLFPIDNLTKKPKGFAFITYMIPENAVTALAQLDGHIFQVFALQLMFEIPLYTTGSAMASGFSSTTSFSNRNMNSLVLSGQDASPPSLHTEEGKA